MAIEKNDILQAIRDTGATIEGTRITGGSISKAAKRLGVSRRTLQSRMRFYGIPEGTAGRRKRKITYNRRARTWGAAAVATAAVVAGAVLVGRAGSPGKPPGGNPA